jgi:hypothetical protein
MLVHLHASIIALAQGALRMHGYDKHAARRTSTYLVRRARLQPGWGASLQGQATANSNSYLARAERAKNAFAEGSPNRSAEAQECKATYVRGEIAVSTCTGTLGCTGCARMKFAHTAVPL